MLKIKVLEQISLALVEWSVFFSNLTQNNDYITIFVILLGCGALGIIVGTIQKALKH